MSRKGPDTEEGGPSTARQKILRGTERLMMPLLIAGGSALLVQAALTFHPELIHTRSRVRQVSPDFGPLAMPALPEIQEIFLEGIAACSPKEEEQIAEARSWIVEHSADIVRSWASACDGDRFFSCPTGNLGEDIARLVVYIEQTDTRVFCLDEEMADAGEARGEGLQLTNP